MNLRLYQRQAIDSLMDWFRANPTGNPMLVLPTGAGKSVVLAMLIREALEQWPATRVLLLTHVKELIQQNAAKMLSVWPQAPLGIYSAGLGRRDTYRQIIFAGIQSVHNKAMHLGAFDLIIIDECHLINHKAQGTYRAFLADCHRANPAVRIIGLTATPFRTTSGALTYGEDAMFSAIAYEAKMLDLIADGYLSNLVNKRMATEADLSGVQTRNGEFVAGQLEHAMDRESLTQAALDEVATYAEGRQRWLVFCAGVAHAENVAKAMNARGWATGCITGKTPAGRRDNLIAQFRAGHLLALTNANVLTTGFDAPETDLLVMLRPTQSPGLYVQMIGRGSRIAPGKADCLVLDFAGNAARHGPVDQIRAWTPQPKGGGPAPMKTCPQCQQQWTTSVRVCTCGHLFEFDETPLHAPSADDTPILSSDTAAKLERTEVKLVTYRDWQSHSSNVPTMRVDYHGQLMRIGSEWICFEHTGYARSKASAWWGKRAPGTPIPNTVAEALARTSELAEPTAITMNTRPKYPEIVSYDWP